MHEPIRRQIETYQPSCQQEATDKQQILTYLDTYEDVLTRANTTCHFTCSSLILNAAHTKTLFIYHKIYQTWCWTGGHADGDTDFLEVALREAREETGLSTINVLTPEIASLDILPVNGHSKYGQWVSSHLHLNVAFLLQADDSLPLTINEQETEGCRWLQIADVTTFSNEPAMLPIYQKLLTKGTQL